MSNKVRKIEGTKQKINAIKTLKKAHQRQKTKQMKTSTKLKHLLQLRALQSFLRIISHTNTLIDSLDNVTVPLFRNGQKD
jgi:hypothetical protein